MLTGESAMTHPLLQSTHCSKIGKLVSHWHPFYSNVCLASPIAGSWFCPTQFSAYEQPWLGRFPQIVPTNDQILKFRSGIYTHCACSWTRKPLHILANNCINHVWYSYVNSFYGNKTISYPTLSGMKVSYPIIRNTVVVVVVCLRLEPQRYSNFILYYIKYIVTPCPSLCLLVVGGDWERASGQLATPVGV